jgi:hypothetical protein
MKIIFPFLLTLIVSCSSGKETTYVGSTPANTVVKTFLGISLTDSVEFIRWKVVLGNDHYYLKCNYGIGQPNTNGFWNNGKWIEMNGELKKENNYYSLQKQNEILKVVELNGSLIHLLDEQKNLLVGTGGFAFTLSAEKGLTTDEVSMVSIRTVLGDSLVFVGRTPCQAFSINPAGSGCIKMKWKIIFYTDPRTHEPTTYLLNRSNSLPLQFPGKTGTWKIITGKNGRIIYELKPANEIAPTYLLKLDENILAFTDLKGDLLVGNEDFAFTLSKEK